MKPYAKAQALKYIGLQDRRRKLTDEQRAEILKIRQETGAGYRTIARQFGVSRSLVRLICDPVAAARVSARMAEHWREYKMTKKEKRERMRAHRARKYDLYKRGQLGESYVEPVKKEKIPSKVLPITTPKGELVRVRLPLPFIDGKGPGVHVGRRWQVTRQSGTFSVCEIKNLKMEG